MLFNVAVYAAAPGTPSGRRKISPSGFQAEADTAVEALGLVAESIGKLARSTQAGVCKVVLEEVKSTKILRP